jgi:hypothetical protein
MTKSLKQGLSLSLFFILLINFSPLFSEEGMFPLSEIHKLDLKSKGFKIDPQELYNPKGVSLIDGIINLSGCSASFVSSKGLILTNYHCAFRGIQSITTKEKDYLRTGFFANNQAEEVEAKGYTVRITESYQDVSKEVLGVIKKNMTHSQRTKAIERQIKKIVVKIEKKNPGKRAEVAEMFKGKTYVLFIYKYLKDIRLVYAPPRSVGEYGGEVDNWMWPRHTGDFAFMRAYTAPDGSTADFSPKNIPYTPKNFLKVAPEGVKEEDFVFILGYPGRTHRHKTSHFISYEEEIRMPYVVDLYSWIIDLNEKMSLKDRSIAIKLAPTIKGLWNTKKRSMGQLHGLKNLELAKRRAEEEKNLQAFIEADQNLKKKYGHLLKEIGDAYSGIRQNAKYRLTVSYLLRFPCLLSSAFTVYEASIERGKRDTDRESAYMDRNFTRTKRRLSRNLRNFYEPSDKTILKELMMRALKLQGDQSIPVLREIVKGKNMDKALDEYLESAYKQTALKDSKVFPGLFKKSKKQLEAMTDPFMVLARSLYPLSRQIKESQKKENGILDRLYSDLIDVKKKFVGKEFIPDANRTLRLTFGRIRGYWPKDAVYSRPFTTLTGVIEKNTGESPFVVPKKLFDLHEKKDYGKFAHPQLNDVPVAMLYNLDTTGGNSGSPILNERGELIGLNFDRVWEATINDYAWDEKYSRSIGVDIRYILWFLNKFSNTNYLLKEMGII